LTSGQLLKIYPSIIDKLIQFTRIRSVISLVPGDDPNRSSCVISGDATCLVRFRKLSHCDTKHATYGLLGLKNAVSVWLRLNTVVELG